MGGEDRKLKIDGWAGVRHSSPRFSNIFSGPEKLAAADSQNFKAPKTREQYITPLVQVILVLIVVALILSLINRCIPMAGSIKSILNAAVVMAVIVWLLNVFGRLANVPGIHVG